jgi:hypothetical protein
MNQVFKLALAAALLLPRISSAHDDGQWGNADPTVREWYRSLMRPDAPASPCCGEADAYWADEIHVRNGKVYATITDDRDDTPLRRPHLDIGTQIEVPPEKLKWDRGNPTGHNVIFVSSGTMPNYVWCFVQTTGG